jgi:hypothetical protein
MSARRQGAWHNWPFDFVLAADRLLQTAVKRKDLFAILLFPRPTNTQSRRTYVPDHVLAFGACFFLVRVFFVAVCWCLNITFFNNFAHLF